MCTDEGHKLHSRTVENQQVKAIVRDVQKNSLAGVRACAYPRTYMRVRVRPRAVRVHIAHIHPNTLFLKRFDVQIMLMVCAQGGKKPAQAAHWRAF
jgi:hypothetical protein